MLLAHNESHVSITSILHMKYEVEADSSKEQQGRERKPTVVYLSSLQLFLEISAEWLDADHAKYLL